MTFATSTLYPRDNIFIDSNFTNCTQKSIYSASGSNQTFINTTYNVSNEDVSIGSLSRKWYLRTQINDSSTGNPITEANITIFNFTNYNTYSALTDANGQITKRPVIEYVSTSGGRSYETPHNITVNKTGYTLNITTINFTQTKNYVHIVNLIATIAGDCWTYTAGTKFLAIPSGCLFNGTHGGILFEI